jgi:hypothetical protein
MPVQHTLFGRPIPRIHPRRVAQFLAGIAVFAVFTLVLRPPSSIPSGESLSKFTDGHRISIPKPKLPSSSILNPFRATARPPPIQANSTSGDSSWYSDWKWLSPFSSSVTLDENRSLLPPLLERPPIYTYYDHTIKKAAGVKDAEHDLLITWRRAWWAQGFKPMILGPAEAMNSPLYEEMQRLDLESSTKSDMMRWLAWESMGTGMMAQHLTLPMGSHEDPLLSYLRRGDYPLLTRYDGLDSGLFAGSKPHITAAIKAAMASPDIKTAKDLFQVVPVGIFTLEPTPKSIAFYDAAIMTSKYPKLADAILKNSPQGLKMLNQLINAHLHSTWQDLFSGGISVLKPLKAHMTAIVEPAVELASFLAQCPESPVVSSCPPNNAKCKPCVLSHAVKITTPTQYQNKSDVYTIGVVPHPYTLAILTSLRETLDIAFIRRELSRDPWITSATELMLGRGVSGSPRVVKFKEAVASSYGSARSVWFTPEKPIPSDLDWHFGFEIPQYTKDKGESETPVPGPERRPQPPPADPYAPPMPNAEELAHEKLLLEKAIIEGKGKLPQQVRIREAIESWNLADIEAWRFARAFSARSGVERKSWEEGERKYAGGAGAARETQLD